MRSHVGHDPASCRVEYSTKIWVGWPDDGNPYAPAQPTLINALDIVLHLTPAK